MNIRLGQILQEQSVLSSGQVNAILERQRATGQPFGLIAESMFGVDQIAVEDAWARQYAGLTRCVDPAQELFDERAVALVTRRQAWQFRLLPVRLDGDEVMMATTREHLRCALRFASRVIGVPTYFVMAEPRDLGAALCRHYPMPGMTPASIGDDGLERLLGLLGDAPGSPRAIAG